MLTIRSKVGQLVLEFRDADVLRNAASCLDIAIGRQQRHDAGVQRPVIAVEAPCQLHDHWRPWVFRQTGESVSFLVSFLVLVSLHSVFLLKKNFLTDHFSYDLNVSLVLPNQI